MEDTHPHEKESSMKTTSLDGRSAVDLLPCPDDHGGALHTEVVVRDDRGVRRYADRYVCPGGPIEAGAWLQGALAHLEQPGSVLQLCDALQVTLVGRELGSDGVRVHLLVGVPDPQEPGACVDAVALELDEAQLVELATWWHARALAVIRDDQA